MASARVGFLRVKCDACRHEKLVGFSCKRRGFCPSCGARRMAETAAHLVEHVLPEQPIRQWVLSFPYPLRFLFATRPAVLTQVLSIVYRAISTFLVRRAGLRVGAGARTGAVTLIQRFGSALNLNPHLHMLFVDGAYAFDDQAPRLHRVAAPTQAELQRLLHAIATRTTRALERQGLLLRDDQNPSLDLEPDDGFEQLLGAAVHYRIATGPHAGRNPAARQWLDSVANVRIHGETHKRPLDLFALERDQLRPLPELLYDLGAVHTVRASNRFRVTFDTNRYSVPAEYASQRLTLKSYPDRLCIYHHDRLLARHPRSYERHRDFEHPDHPRALLEQRRKATTQRLLQRFVSLTARADEYYRELAHRRLNPVHHVRKIVALSEIYGADATARALDDAFEYGAFSSDYITNLLEARARSLPEPSALHLTRRADLLELELPQPDLSLYDLTGGPRDDTP